jgi:hypothetical protein
MVGVLVHFTDWFILPMRTGSEDIVGVPNYLNPLHDYIPFD